MTSRIIQSSGWPFHVVVKVNDLIVRGVIATWFGGDDPQDDGSTASGVFTKGNPGLLGCSLPVLDRGRCPQTSGSPLGNIPWETMIKVTTIDGISLTVPLIDVGPAKSTFHGIDLTQAAFIALGGDLNVGILSCDYMVTGGALFVS